jgi:hypothetical protein
MTSIETLVYNLVYNNLVDNSPNSKLWEIVEQAKQKHKREIIDAHIQGHNAPSSTLKNFDAEQYYKETYKKD